MQLVTAKLPFAENILFCRKTEISSIPTNVFTLCENRYLTKTITTEGILLGLLCMGPKKYFSKFQNPTGPSKGEIVIPIFIVKKLIFSRLVSLTESI